MRRTSVFLALAAIFLTATVGFTYWLRLSKIKPHPNVAPQIGVQYDARAPQGWHRQKDDPDGNRPVYIVDAETFQGTKDPSTFELKKLSLRLFNKDSSKYTLVKAAAGLFDERTGLLKSDGQVSVVMSVPAKTAPTDTKELDKHVHI